MTVQVNGAEITTIEGVESEGVLHPLQQSFIDKGGFQCGICTSGQIVAAKALLDANPSPTQEEVIDWMMGNLCRCTGYYQILDSISQVIEAKKKTETSTFQLSARKRRLDQEEEEEEEEKGKEEKEEEGQETTGNHKTT